MRIHPTILFGSGWKVVFTQYVVCQERPRVKDTEKHKVFIFLNTS